MPEACPGSVRRARQLARTRAPQGCGRRGDPGARGSPRRVASTIVHAGSVVLALVLCACGARTLLDGPVPVDAATLDSTGIIVDASAADSGDLDGPQLIGPDLEAALDSYAAPDACINPYDRDSSAMCITRTDCCQVAIGTSCLGGRCIPDHTQ